MLLMLHTLVRNGFKGVIEGRAILDSQSLQHLELGTHPTEVVLGVVHLGGLVGQLHEDVVEHDVLHVVEGGDLERHHEAVTEYLLLDRPLLEGNQGATFFFVGMCKVDQELLELSKGDETCCLLVIVRPKADKVINSLLFDWHATKVGRTKESVNDNSDEEVEEDLRDDDLIDQVEGNRNASSTALRTVSVLGVVTASNDGIVILLLNALIVEGARLGRVEHD